MSAKDEASGKVNSISSSIKGGLASAASAAAKATAAAIALTGAAVVKIGKQAFDAYSSYEQLAGGVDKLFGDASEQLKQHAQEAYKTSGMSANQYMEQATSFSAALVNSLGGDQQRAAELTDVAMRAMSDNVNVFGSNMVDVQNAFQGFAKQNYTMLDNLKLGYGGTKSEMERLIADANEYAAATGRASDLSIDSFADIVQAIQLIQEKQGIAGTTAKEAATTIEGSINMTKAAWVNLLTEIGKQDGDIPARMQELMESVTNVVSNVTPVIQRVIEGIAQAAPILIPAILDSLGQIFQVVADNLPAFIQILITTIISAAPQMIDAAFQLFLAILQALNDVSPQIADGLATLLVTLVDKLVQYAPQIAVASAQLFQQILIALVQKSPEILAELGRSLIDMEWNVSGKAGDMLRAGLALIGGLLDGVRNKISELPHAIWEGIKAAVYEVANFNLDMYNAGVSITSGLADGIRAGFSNAISAVAGGLSMIRSYLPFSPAKRGPFSGQGWTLYSGMSMMEALGDGIREKTSGAVELMESAMSGIRDAASKKVVASVNVSAVGRTPAMGQAGADGLTLAGDAVAAAPTVNIYFNDVLVNDDGRIKQLFRDFMYELTRNGGM